MSSVLRRLLVLFATGCLVACGAVAPKRLSEPEVIGTVVPLKRVSVYYNNSVIRRALYQDNEIKGFRNRHKVTSDLLKRVFEERGVLTSVYASESDLSLSDAFSNAARFQAEHLVVLYMERGQSYRQGSFNYGVTGGEWILEIYPVVANSRGKAQPVYREKFKADELCTVWNKEGECAGFIPNYVIQALESKGFVASKQGT
jgi:hypothetical protein